MPGETPIASLPIDTDTLDSASTYQPWKTGADYNAFLMQSGRMRVYQQNFQYTSGIQSTTAFAPNDKSMNVTIAGGSSLADFDTWEIGQGGADYSNRAVLLAAGGSSGNLASLSTSRISYNGSCTALQLCLEQDLQITDTTVGDYRFGLTDDTSVYTKLVGMRHLHTDTNWVLVWDGGTTAVTTSAPANGVWQKFKIIYSGAATPAGVANSNTALIRVYLNDSLLLTRSGTFLGSGVSVYAFNSAKSTGASGAEGVFGGMCLSWNPYL